MKSNIVAKLRDFLKKFKINEEEYYSKFKDLVGDEKQHSGNSSIDSKTNMTKNANFLQSEQKHHDDILRARDIEINSLVKTINELASMFKDLQALVVEQGTILDRIDYNIDTANKSIVGANDHLTQADKNLSSSCARNANLVLVFIIFVLSLMLLLKLK
jgi:hypothetical protein